MQFNIGAHTILLRVQNFLRGVFRDAVYPKDIWHGDATYPRIFCRGVPKIGGVEYPITPGLILAIKRMRAELTAC